MLTTQQLAIAIGLTATLFQLGISAQAVTAYGGSSPANRGTANSQNHQVVLNPSALEPSTISAESATDFSASELSAIVAASVTFIGTLGVGHLLHRRLEE